jgi:DNA-binding MarR family transcriptional regulator
LSAPTLSKQVSILEKAGYVKVNKGYVGKRPRTWLSLSSGGRRAFGSHMAALAAIAALPARSGPEPRAADAPSGPGLVTPRPAEGGLARHRS